MHDIGIHMKILVHSNLDFGKFIMSVPGAWFCRGLNNCWSDYDAATNVDRISELIVDL